MSFPLPARFHHLGQLTGLVHKPVSSKIDLLWVGPGPNGREGGPFCWWGSQRWILESILKSHRSSGTLKTLNWEPNQTIHNRYCGKFNLSLFTADPVQDVSFSVLPWPLGHHQIGTAGGGLLLSARERRRCSSAAVPYQWGEPHRELWSTTRVTFHSFFFCRKHIFSRTKLLIKSRKTTGFSI